MKIKSGFVLQEVGGSYIAVAVGEASGNFSSIVKLNGTGAFFWKLMQERDISREELVSEVLKVYTDVSAEQVMNDVVALENKLRSNGILE